MILAIYRKELANKFKVEGFKIFSQEEWDKFELGLTLYNKEIFLYPLSCEAVIYTNGKELLEDIQEIDLRDEDEYDTEEYYMYDTWLGSEFGYFPQVNIKLTNE